ncbi:hypothetical protein [Pseudohalioglobus lutimaris]|uniref:Uncharacterized protein n=1 Tax=Pseudohalioglobus lutimaris TaxID=1737061 RepID=A0A2N5X201_9GAMM|nr:hypothetical protein [Pseudohalioglobus lutimaris]PLW68521.1 hypothetical protein C0039_12155 [Pseudohalioglobus lutimaris]
MKRRDEGKTSLVEFLSSIKFARRDKQGKKQQSNNRFARFDQRAPVSQPLAMEDSYLIRSAN